MAENLFSCRILLLSTVWYLEFVTLVCRISRFSLQEEWELWQHVREGLKILLNTRIRRHQENSAVPQNISCAEETCVYQFVLLDWFEELINTTKTSNTVESKWRPLLRIEATNGSRTNRTTIGSHFLLVPLVPSLKNWARIKEGITCDLGDDEVCVDSDQKGKSLRLCTLTLGLHRCDWPILILFSPLAKSKITLPVFKRRIQLVDKSQRL